MTHSIEINSFIALTIGFVVFFAGQYLTEKIRFLAVCVPKTSSGFV